jgi:two-component system chemotaxis response regulator CheB
MNMRYGCFAITFKYPLQKAVMRPPVVPAATPTWIIAIAASAGGIPAIHEVLNHLPKDFPGAVMVLLHMERSRDSHLAEMFARGTTLQVSEARDGEALAVGHVYMAPPDFHLTVSRDRHVALNKQALVHFVRPAADVLFSSLARLGGSGIAVILSGSGYDGACGASAVHRAGGIVITQDETTSLHFSMPRAAAQHGPADYILPIEKISALLVSLTASHDRN